MIEAAVMSWDKPLRVKQFTLPLSRDDKADLDHMETLVAEGVGRDMPGDHVISSSVRAAEKRVTPLCS